MTTPSNPPPPSAAKLAEEIRELVRLWGATHSDSGRLEGIEMRMWHFLIENHSSIIRALLSQSPPAQDGEELAEVERRLEVLTKSALKVRGWFEGQAMLNDQKAKTCNYASLKDAYVADAVNYRAMAKDLSAALASQQGGKDE